MLKLSAILPWALPLLGLYIGYCGLLFVFQRSLVFPGAGIRRPPSLEREYPQGQVVWLETSFGRVESWYFPLPTGAGPTPAVIIAHGNAETIPDLLPPFLRFNDLGLAVLLVEYPGYGRSDASPSQDTVTEAFVTAYDSLAARPEIDATRISACGRSLGGAAACVLAEERPVASLILLSTFTSLRAMSRRFMAPGILVRDPFDNLAVVRSFAGPVLVVHGTEDSLIPHHHGEQLAAAARQGRLVTYRCGHNDCPPDWGHFWREVEDFLDQSEAR